MKKTILLFVFFSVFFVQKNLAQECCPYIDTVQLTPTNATTNDSIHLIIHLATPGLGNFIHYDITETDTLTTVEACYYSGPLTAIQYYEDTLNLGVRPAGIFKVKFIAWISANDTTCNYLQNQSQELEMNIDGTNSNFEIDISEINIFPNPVENHFTISSKKNLVAIEIYNQLGMLVSAQKQMASNQVNLNIEHFESGIYFLKCYLDSEAFFSKRIIKR